MRRSEGRWGCKNGFLTHNAGKCAVRCTSWLLSLNGGEWGVIGLNVKTLRVRVIEVGMSGKKYSIFYLRRDTTVLF